MFKFFQAVLILSGMIIGAGMFGIPFSFVASGFWLGALELLVLAAVTLVLHLIYGEIVLKTPALHRLPGYIRIHLGEKWSFLAWIGAFVGILGTLLAYIIVGSIFLKNIFGVFGFDLNEVFFAVIFAFIGACIVFFPLKKEAFVNGILTAVLIGFTVFLIFILLPKIEPPNFSGFNLRGVFSPYGVLLFALSGGIVIPDLITFLGRKRTLARYAILAGTLIPAALYFFFAYAVVGSLGARVSIETIGGLRSVVGENVIILGSIIGFLAVFTSFVALGASARAMLTLDFGLKKNFSWILVSFLPFIFYLFGFKNFIAIIGALGALVGGVDAGLIIGAYHKVQQKEGYAIPFFSYFWKILIYLMIIAGVFYELYLFFK